MITVSSGIWNNYLKNQYEWGFVYNDNPIDGLRHRDGFTHSKFHCVASGINSYSEKDHCGGINQISHSNKDNIWKIDSYCVRPKINSSEFEIALIDKRSYPELHHIKKDEKLYEMFSGLGREL